ncbi:MAG: MBL fold metallo-hydrolase [Armatimonadetes bacterium]|nr:MBL fold metallo-hydrolase [Armatimonadota bacterium]
MERLIKAKVEPGRVAIHWLGQGGFAFKAHAGGVIVVDPYLSDSANGDGSAARLVDIPVRPRDVRLDYLFLTHDHLDHTDPQTAPAIAQNNPDAPIVCPPSSAHHLTKLGVPGTQIRTAMPGQSLPFPNFVAHVVAAEHTEDSVGYVFEFNEEGSETANVSVYITGDTEYNDGLAAAVEEFGPDVLLVPINGRWGNMDAAHAARLAAAVAPREVIPMHYGMFAANTADPNDFLALLAAAMGPESETVPVVMKHNACHIFCPAESAQGRYGHKKARAERARQGRRGHEHHDGVRGPNGGSGIARGGGRGR